jgi:hypothetical protein
MADVSINIRKVDPNNPNNTTNISVSGFVDDAALNPFTAQLSTLLSAAATISPSASGSAPVG